VNKVLEKVPEEVWEKGPGEGQIISIEFQKIFRKRVPKKA